MRIGVQLDDQQATAADLAARADPIVRRGFSGGLWFGEFGGWDPLTAITALAQVTRRLPLSTAIVTSYPRHPLVLARQALGVQAVTGDRLTLGVGVSHPHLVEGRYGLAFERPARHLREYLSVLGPALRGEEVAYTGETLRATGSVALPGVRAPQVLVGALGPAMLRLAGRMADGTVTSWAGPTALEHHIVPVITEAANGAGRPAPRVAAGVLVCVSDRAEERRAEVADLFGGVRHFPAYRAALDREGAGGPADLAVIGTARQVERDLRRLVDAGATELLAWPLGRAEEQEAALDLLAALDDG